MSPPPSTDLYVQAQMDLGRPIHSVPERSHGARPSQMALIIGRLERDLALRAQVYGKSVGAATRESTSDGGCTDACTTSKVRKVINPSSVSLSGII